MQDYRSRQASLIGECPEDLVREVLKRGLGSIDVVWEVLKRASEVNDVFHRQSEPSE